MSDLEHVAEDQDIDDLGGDLELDVERSETVIGGAGPSVPTKPTHNPLGLGNPKAPPALPTKP